jgi:hypothetical protein
MRRARSALIGVAALFVHCAASESRADEGHTRLAGRWTVTFENGIVEWCTIGSDRTASVLEKARNSPGRTEARGGSLLITYDDDRIERWTAVGRRAVVEHWFPAAAYPLGTPVWGIAETLATADPDDTQRADPDGRDLRRMVTSKSFAAALRQTLSDETAGQLRKFIDPRYLKEHQLEAGPFPIRRLVTGSIYDNWPVDDQTVLVVVETVEAEKEIWLLRMADHEGGSYIAPPAAPDPATRSFKPWLLRRKL